MLKFEDYAFSFRLCFSRQIMLKIMLAYCINAYPVEEKNQHCDEKGASSRKDFHWYETFLPARGRENTVRSTRKPKQLILPRANTRRYFFRSALLWNTLPAHLQNITCHRKFKKNIEAHWSAHKYSTSFAFCHEVFHDEPCPMPNCTHLAQLATLFYVFSSLPSTSFSSSLLLLLLLLLL